MFVRSLALVEGRVQEQTFAHLVSCDGNQELSALTGESLRDFMPSGPSSPVPCETLKFIANQSTSSSQEQPEQLGTDATNYRVQTMVIAYFTVRRIVTDLTAYQRPWRTEVRAIQKLTCTIHPDHQDQLT